MKIVRLTKRALGAASTAALFAACSGGGGSQLAPTAPETSQSNSQAIRLVPGTLVSKAGVSALPDPGKSWMNRTAMEGALLYVSDAGDGVVDVYSYPKGVLVGTLTGFSEPQGECADKAGNVWIADTAGSQLIEYAHGGTSPIATLGDPGQYPLDAPLT